VRLRVRIDGIRQQIGFVAGALHAFLIGNRGNIKREVGSYQTRHIAEIFIVFFRKGRIVWTRTMVVIKIINR
jgi:hypothetical protein